MSDPSPTDQYLAGYDRFVSIMRMLLPAVAILTLLVAVLWPLLNPQEISFTLSPDELRPNQDKIRVRGAHYTGTDGIDRLFTLSADEAVQDRPDDPIVTLKGLQADMLLSEGRQASVTAGEGRYLSADRMLDIDQGAQLLTSDGYAIRLGQVRVDLSAKIAISDQPVQGRSPLGAFEADGLELRADRRVAYLTGNVRMRVQPRKSQEPTP